MQLGALHVPDDWELKNDFNSRVGTGKVSAYLRSLVEKDLSGTAQKPDATDENVLVELCERLRPDKAGRLRYFLELEEASQVALLGKMLEELLEAMSAKAKTKDTSLGDRPVVLMKVLREDTHSIQAAYKFRNSDVTPEELAQLFDVNNHKNIPLNAALEAAKSSPSKK